MSGKAESSTLTSTPMVRSGRCRREAPGIVVLTRWIGTHALETIGKRDAETIGRGTYEVSPDGRTLTAKVCGIDAQGAECEQEIVFDRAS